MSERERYEWRVQYRRRDWSSRQGRIFQSIRPVQRLLERLRRADRDYEPIVELRAQRRVVGAWEDVPISRVERAR